MTWKLPFDEDMLSELIGSALVLSKNNALSSLFVPFNEIALEKGGLAKGIGGWEIDNGTLRLCDDKGGLLYEFCSIEIKKGCVYAVGRNVLESSVTGVPRVILHKKALITSTDVGICVSSHVDYEKATLPRLFKSLKRDGFNMGNVFTIVGGDNKATGDTSVDPEYGVRVTRQKQSCSGFTAFSNLSDFGKLHYWLLLHDTCDVMDGFSEKVRSVDIGLNPDIILFGSAQEKLEIGIYSSEFVSNSGIPTQSTKHGEFLDTLLRRAKIAVTLNSVVKKEVERDIYGMGNKRETIIFSSLGIRKFKGKAIIDGKP